MIPPVANYEGLYEHRYSKQLQCSILSNVSKDRILRVWGNGAIDPPVRQSSTAAGWVAETTAQAADQAEVTHQVPGSVVVLPGESVRLFSHPPAQYQIALVDVKANQAAKVAASLANLAVDRRVKVLATRADLTNTINACAIAADSTWREVKEIKGVESLQDVLTEMTALGPCKAAYDVIAPPQEPTKDPLVKRWLTKAAAFGDDFWQNLRTDLARKARTALTSVR
jgi:hypothetical protein